MSNTIKIGNSEFQLAAVPVASGGVTAVKVKPAESVTPEAVYVAVSEASSYIIVTDGTAAPKTDNVVFIGQVEYDGENITFTLRQKSSDEIKREQMQAQIDALGAQLTAIALGGVSQ